jgi:hypothetical protein
MGVVEAKIQTVEDIYRLVWAAVATKKPVSAVYKGLPRLFCPHRLGRNRAKQLRVLCYQCGGESESGLAPMGSPENWRCVVLEKLRKVELLQVRGRPHRIIPVRQVVSSRLISMPRISQNAIRRKDTERPWRANSGQ